MAEAGTKLGWCSRCPMHNGIAVADGEGGWLCDRCGRTGIDPTMPQPTDPDANV